MSRGNLQRGWIACLFAVVQNCVEQSFDSPPRISVSKNTALGDDFAANIHSCLAGVTAKLGTLISTASALLFFICLLLECFLFCSVSKLLLLSLFAY